MPNIDGFRVCEAIRTSPDTRHIRLLVVTGYHDQENIDRALRSGADCCMAKPLAVRELKLKVEELLHTGPTRFGRKLSAEARFHDRRERKRDHPRR